MPADEHHRRLERMYAAAPVTVWFGSSIQISERRAVVTIPIKEQFLHSARSVHGSIYFRALDDAAFFAVSSAVEDVFVVTVSFNVYFTRPASSGLLRAEGRLSHASSRLYIAESTLTDEQGKLLAQGSGTFMKTSTPLGESLGYV